MKVIALLIFFSLLTPLLVSAGGYSDYSANKSRGQSSSDLTLKYGGTYGQAGQNYMNYRHGYGSGQNNDYYSRHHPNNPGNQQKQQLSPEQKAEIERLMKQSDDLINRINNDSKIWN